jgi:hypothetical protein
MPANLTGGGWSLRPDREVYAAMLAPRPPPPPRPPGTWCPERVQDPRPRRTRGRGGAIPHLTRRQAVTARNRAREVGIAATARELNVAYSTLTKTWHRYGIPGPGPRKAVAHPRARALSRPQAVAAAIRAREVGRDQVARELHVSSWTLWASWRRWDIQGPGKGNAARIRDQRRVKCDATDRAGARPGRNLSSRA